MGDERRADPTIREVEWFREMVFEYFVARLSRRTVGFGGISPIFTPTADGWSEGEDLLAAMANAVAGSLRG